MINPEVLNLLLQLGSAGAVIAVVIIFLKQIDKRDEQWRSFFTELNKANANDMTTLTCAMRSLTESVREIAANLATHDRHVDERVNAAANRKTITRKPRATKEE